MNLAIDETKEGFLVITEDVPPGTAGKVFIRILGTGEMQKQMADDLQSFLQHYEEDYLFYKEIDRSVKPPEPSEFEKIQMQANLYDDRLRQLKVFIDKVQSARFLIDVACRLVLMSIHGSRDRAIQHWIHSTTDPHEVRSMVKQ